MVRAGAKAQLMAKEGNYAELSNCHLAKFAKFVWKLPLLYRW